MRNWRKCFWKCYPFAIVKDTARRFMENEQLEVTASMFDKEMSGKAEHVNLKGDKAVWNNTWKAAGNDITWDMMHYDVQLIGGTPQRENC